MHDQALARAMKLASGGNAPENEPFERAAPYTVGYIHSKVPGRTDKLPTTVPSGAYVIPADIVSGFGEGNSMAGAHFLERLFHSGPYGIPHRAQGGRLGGNHPPTPVILAGGEFVVAPEAVKKVGGGDIDKGHEVLDRMVVKQRKKLVGTLSKLPGPKKT